MTTIELTQQPIIRHDLIAVGANVTARLEALNISGQIATEDTVKSLKELRAQLNKELAEFEAQRKAVKEAVNNPYNEFEAVYKTEVSEKYKSAIDQLKDKVAEVEDRIKANRTEELKGYFAELAAFEGIDWLKFEQLDIDVKLSTSDKQYKEKIREFVTKVVDELDLIDTNPHRAEVLVEYKRTLNAAKAIKEVQARKDAEKQEADRIKFEETNRRASKLRSMAMVLRDITQTYEYNAEIYVTREFVENATKEEFNTKVVEIETAIKASITQSQPEPAATPEAPKTQVAPPLQPPTVEAPATLPEEFTARFEVKGTREKLLALGEYLRANEIIYTNIK